MFERYTEAARRALFFARFEVTQLGATAIEPEHILLGLFREPKGLVARIFEQRGVSGAELSVEIADRHEFRERIPTSVEVPFSTGTQRVLSYAAEEADRLTHTYIGTEHLLLGVLREERSMGAELLVQQGLTLDGVRKAIVELLQVRAVETEGGASGGGDDAEHLAAIRRLAAALARLPPETPEVRQVVEEIEGHLRALERWRR
jgi:ATP-dependent Clp protease ATP-binding subunit ClpC